MAGAILGVGKFLLKHAFTKGAAGASVSIPRTVTTAVGASAAAYTGKKEHDKFEEDPKKYKEEFKKAGAEVLEKTDDLPAAIKEAAEAGEEKIDSTLEIVDNTKEQINGYKEEISELKGEFDNIKDKVTGLTNTASDGESFLSNMFNSQTLMASLGGVTTFLAASKFGGMGLGLTVAALFLGFMYKDKLLGLKDDVTETVANKLEENGFGMSGPEMT